MKDPKEILKELKKLNSGTINKLKDISNKI